MLLQSIIDGLEDQKGFNSPMVMLLCAAKQSPNLPPTALPHVSIPQWEFSYLLQWIGR